MMDGEEPNIRCTQIRSGAAEQGTVSQSPSRYISARTSHQWGPWGRPIYLQIPKQRSFLGPSTKIVCDFKISCDRRNISSPDKNQEYRNKKEEPERRAIILWIYRWKLFGGTHPEAALPSAMSMILMSRTCGFDSSNGGRGTLWALGKKDPLSIDESVFPALFSRQITFYSRYSFPIIWNSMSALKLRRLLYISFCLSKSELSAPEQHTKLSKNHTFKNSSMACVAITFSNFRGSFWMK